MFGAVMGEGIDLPLGIVRAGIDVGFEANTLGIGTRGPLHQFEFTEILVQVPERILRWFHFVPAHRPRGGVIPRRGCDLKRCIRLGVTAAYKVEFVATETHIVGGDACVWEA